MNKNAISLLLLFFLQFFATSCTICECGSLETYEKKYGSIQLKAWDTSGFNTKEILEFVNKTAFGISIFLDSELEQISYVKKQKSNISSLGFSAAYACDCIGPEYINNDPIASIQISVTNAENDQVSDVTSNFSIYGFEGKQITIQEYIESIGMDQNFYSNDIFRVDMTVYGDIPQTSIFTVTTVLKSGKKLIENTQEIKFK